MLFFRNKAKKLLKTKKDCGKKGQNKAKTNLANLLKIRLGLKNKPKTNLKLLLRAKLAARAQEMLRISRARQRRIIFMK
jgi:hypothetical protein